jgi:hypothetical protein
VSAVEGLAGKVPAMREAGMGSEAIARALHAERRLLGEQFKALTPPGRLAEIYERNLARYGDKLGPTIEWLQARGKSWEDIIESSVRTGGKDLGF